MGKTIEISYIFFVLSICLCVGRREQNQKDDRFDWYASGDSKDCVALDKDGNGAFQLWQRQLCQFPLASRETSEAISSLYPSPLSLMKVWTNPNKYFSLFLYLLLSFCFF